MATTLLLDPTTWDLCLDASGDIALAQEPYAIAQDVASAVKLFLGEYWYDLSLGTPYFQTTLGKIPPLQVVKSQVVAAALTVPGVKSAQCFISSINNRNIAGQVQITTTSGQILTTGFAL
jgi:hypothetical protein